MRKLGPLVAILVLLTSLDALAQPQTMFLSIPSSGFTPQEGVSGGASYLGNRSGTARSFSSNLLMFAPVNLPHGASVISLRCGGADPAGFRIRFTLRRNEPQQANVDMATVMTSFEGTGFQFVSTTSITAPVVNNSTFNYYMIAALEATFETPLCGSLVCSVGFCRIGYTINQ
jgi:hypothetical protein